MPRQAKKRSINTPTNVSVRDIKFVVPDIRVQQFKKPKGILPFRLGRPKGVKIKGKVI